MAKEDKVIGDASQTNDEIVVLKTSLDKLKAENDKLSRRLTSVSKSNVEKDEKIVSLDREVSVLREELGNVALAPEPPSQKEVILCDGRHEIAARYRSAEEAMGEFRMRNVRLDSLVVVLGRKLD